ncbi:hypothetical protein B9Z19DRAFT_1097207 [Tuber borchii]|uniref:Uncharacterized protein n=1 Tax=Tuber borchii TaxID=42251 RepID=A0A2T6ZAI0_TUBBO|nr:hypothetical protein B9Z19DRAFT_1097207 [Tuber borchii]
MLQGFKSMGHHSWRSSLGIRPADRGPRQFYVRTTAAFRALKSYPPYQHLVLYCSIPAHNLDPTINTPPSLVYQLRPSFLSIHPAPEPTTQNQFSLHPFTRTSRMFLDTIGVCNPPPTMPEGYELHSSDIVPELVEIVTKPDHPLERCWPAFISQASSDHDLMYRVPYFSKYQFIVTHNGSPVALSNAVPFYWPELEQHGPQPYGTKGWRTVSETLPDGGWDWAWRSAMSLYFSNNPTTTTGFPEAEIYTGHENLVGKQPNAVCALAVAIDPAYRRRGIADALLQNYKDLTRVCSYEAMVVPIRPTRKTEFLHVKMEDYVSWAKWASAGVDEPFDPWIRTHVRLGGQVIKVCHESMRIEADVDTWERWTGVRFTSEEALCRKDEDGRTYWEMSVASALSYVRYFPDLNRGVYTEPNVWIRHV